MEKELKRLLSLIRPANEAAKKAARDKWNNIAHPLNGLGELENIIVDAAGFLETPEVDFGNLFCDTSKESELRRVIYILCADHRVVAQGVSQSPSEVTTNVALNLAIKRTCACKMAEQARCEVVPVDMGILDFQGFFGVRDLRIGNGTGDISIEPAMERAQAIKAIHAGISLAFEAKERGMKLIATGEMGIGNTTPSAAIISCLLGLEPELTVGKGAGLSNEGLARKTEVVKKALLLHSPDPDDPIDVLTKVGGFEIAGMCGLFLGGAITKIPVVIDGMISAAAALCSKKLAKDSVNAMIASHVSEEPGAILALEHLGKKAVIRGGFHLGEGTGALAMLPLLDLAQAVYQRAYTFDDCGIEAYKPL